MDPLLFFFAGIAHLLLAIRAQRLYNPGLLVSVVINIPIGLWSILFLIDQGVLPNFFVNPYILIGLGLNALLPIMGIALLRGYEKSA